MGQTRHPPVRYDEPATVVGDMEQLSLLEASRQEAPGLNDRAHVIRLADRLLVELEERPPISLDTVAGWQGISEIRYSPLPTGGCLVTDPTTARSEIRLRQRDHPLRQRFSGFHEVTHTFMPGYQLRIQWRCDPSPHRQSQADVEGLCDHGAAELILPRRFVTADLAEASFGMTTVVDLSDRYEASLQASAHRFVGLWPEDTLLIVAERANKPSEGNDPTAPAKLRVGYAWRRGDWPFIKPHKSFADDDPLQRALAGEVIDEDASLREVADRELEDLHVSAQLCPYTDAQGRRHERVLALYRKRRRR